MKQDLLCTQVDSVPANPDLTTSLVPLVHRPYMAGAREVYVVDSSNYFIPADGFVSKWLFYVREAGRGAFQVWRRRTDEGTRQ